MDMIDSHLIYQLIIGAVILGAGILFLRMIGILFVVVIIGVFAYYMTMATTGEKADLLRCAKSIPSSVLALKYPSSCQDFTNTVINTVPDKIEERASEETKEIRGKLDKELKKEKKKKEEDDEEVIN